MDHHRERRKRQRCGCRRVSRRRDRRARTNGHSHSRGAHRHGDAVNGVYLFYHAIDGERRPSRHERHGSSGSAGRLRVDGSDASPMDHHRERRKWQRRGSGRVSRRGDRRTRTNGHSLSRGAHRHGDTVRRVHILYRAIDGERRCSRDECHGSSRSGGWLRVVSLQRVVLDQHRQRCDGKRIRVSAAVDCRQHWTRSHGIDHDRGTVTDHCTGKRLHLLDHPFLTGCARRGRQCGDIGHDRGGLLLDREFVRRLDHRRRAERRRATTVDVRGQAERVTAAHRHRHGRWSGRDDQPGVALHVGVRAAVPRAASVRRQRQCTSCSSPVPAVGPPCPTCHGFRSRPSRAATPRSEAGYCSSSYRPTRAHRARDSSRLVAWTTSFIRLVCADVTSRPRATRQIAQTDTETVAGLRTNVHSATSRFGTQQSHAIAG